MFPQLETEIAKYNASNMDKGRKASLHQYQSQKNDMEMSDYDTNGFNLCHKEDEVNKKKQEEQLSANDPIHMYSTHGNSKCKYLTSCENDLLWGNFITLLS